MTFSTDIRRIKDTMQAGQFDSALQILQTSLTNEGNSLEEQVELFYMQAVAHRYNNQILLAEQTLNDLFVLHANYARGFQEQGYCFIAQQNDSAALVAFHKAVEFNPALIASWQKIVELFKRSNHENLEAAQQQFNLLKSLPPMVLAAMDLMHEGKLHKAEQTCRKFLLKHPHQPDAMCLLADIGAKLKVFDDAEFLLESCVNLYPDNEQAKASYIHLLNRLGKFAIASEQAKQFIEGFSVTSPLRTTVQATLANCYVSLGQVDEGIKIYKDILSNSPERTGIYVQIGHAFKAQGSIEKSIEYYQKAYNQQVNHGDAYWSLANIKTYQFDEVELNNIQAAIDKTTTPPQDKIHMHFALGKAYEDQKLFAKSFEHYQIGNDLKSQTLQYDAKNTSKLIQQQVTHCTKELFEQHSNAGSDNSAPIFVVGLPRAGSTLIEQILASHSQVDGTMELHNILGTALKLRGRIVEGDAQYPANLTQLTDEQFKQLGEQFINDTQCYRQSAPYFIDKMPNNFIHIGLIKLMLPNAKIIDARREPMACCFSGFKQLFGEGQEFSYNLSDMAQYYQDYIGLMDHWDEVLPGQIYRVQHEELVNNFEQEVRQLLDYCDLPFEESCLEFYNTKRSILTPSAQQVRQPISKSGLEQWKNYAEFMPELVSRF